MVKAITLLLIKNSDFTFGKESLLSEPSIIFMLTQILQDLPSQKISAALTDKLSGEDKSLLDKFKFIKDGKLFHPLLYALPVPHQEKFNKLSFFEEKIYLLLTRKKGEVVDREDIAKVVWGEIDWEERYSDWAISQVMHRLREKLKKIETAIVIKTVKGKGYLLRKN